MSRYAVCGARVMTSAGATGDAVVVDGGRVVEITNRSLPADLPRREHPGATLLPSLSDSHLHPLGYVAAATGLSLEAVAGMAEMRERLGEAASRLQPDQALVAHRLDDDRLGGLPTRRDLDMAVGDRACLVYRRCGHVAIASTAALQLAGLADDMADPPDGTIDRDAAGLPTGVLRETAIELVSGTLADRVPALSDEEVLAALGGLAALGIGRIDGMVASGEVLWCGTGNELDTLCRLAPDLPIDIDVMVVAETADQLQAAARRIEAAGGHIRFHGWKAFADGSLGGRTAAMWEPYLDGSGTGMMRLEPEWALTMVRTVLDLEGVSAIHAIGDRANDAVIDLYEQVAREGADPSRLRVEHASVLSPGAPERLADLGIVASVQPSFLLSESGWVPELLGPERAARTYRFRRLAELGVVLLGGSDSPVEEPDPLQGMRAAVKRPGWSDGQALTPAAAIGLFTDDRVLSPGSPADLVAVEGEVGGAAKVVAIYRGGREVTAELAALGGLRFGDRPGNLAG